MSETLVLEDFRQFGGKHCQTAALRNILAYHGYDLSEEMLLGLGGGLGFIYWYMKQMSSPFIGFRFGGKNEIFMVNICERIGAEGILFQTTSTRKGYEELKSLLREGRPAYVYADMAYLPYMASEDMHFGGHAVVVFGVDEQEDKVYISDRGGKNAVTVSVEDLKNARSSKFPPFPPKNKILKIKIPQNVVISEKVIKEAIKDCYETMLNPPIRNIGLSGVQKWANIVPKWPEQFNGLNLFGCLFNTFVYIEIGGTGGSAFRPMYAQFLKEVSSMLDRSDLSDVAELFESSGKAWSEVANTALPDSWPTLKKIRELLFEQSRVFEEQKPGTLENLMEINQEFDDLRHVAAKNLQEDDIAPLLVNLREKILESYEIEKKAFQMLKNIIN